MHFTVYDKYATSDGFRWFLFILIKLYSSFSFYAINIDKLIHDHYQKLYIDFKISGRSLDLAPGTKLSKFKFFGLIKIKIFNCTFKYGNSLDSSALKWWITTSLGPNGSRGEIFNFRSIITVLWYIICCLTFCCLAFWVYSCDASVVSIQWILNLWPDSPHFITLKRT